MGTTRQTPSQYTRVYTHLSIAPPPHRFVADSGPDPAEHQRDFCKRNALPYAVDVIEREPTYFRIKCKDYAYESGTFGRDFEVSIDTFKPYIDENGDLIETPP